MANKGKITLTDCKGNTISVGSRVYYIPEECTVNVSQISRVAATGYTDEGMRYCMDPIDCVVVDVTI